MSNSGNDVESISQALQSAVNKNLLELHTACPGRVLEFDPVTQLAAVQLGIKRKLTQNGESSWVSLPKLINVPVVFQRGGGYSFTMPVKPDDECLVVFSERAIDLWHEKGGEQKQNANRRHALSDAIAIVGINSKPNKIPTFNSEHPELKADNGSATIGLKDGGEIYLSSNLKVDITSPTVNVSNDLNVGGNTTIAGNTDITGNTAITGNTDITGNTTMTTAAASAIGAGSMVVSGIEMGGHTHPYTDDGANKTTGVAQ